MPEVTLNDITVHLEQAGSGPPLLLLRGLGSSGEDWEFQIGPLSREFEVFAPDFRGHGRSGKPAGPYSIAQFAADTTALMEALSIGPVTIVGISLGGMVAFQIAADRPDLVEELVAVNALPAFETSRVSQRIQLATRKVITRRLTMARIGSVLSKRLFPDPGLEEQRATMVERWSRNDKTAYQASFQAILDWEGVAGAMAATEIPSTVLSCDLDYISSEDKQPYVDAMPTAEMVTIEDAHHGVPMERPDRFNQLLAEILS
jgi:pimeloyl-ACP methyl ester carboxylesterase